jgi:hypothetical protein
MHQDIRTFSDLLDIDTSRGLEVAVKLRANGSISYQFKVNDDLVNGEFWSKTYDLRTPFKFSCLITEYTPNHSGIDIVSVSINSIEILPLYAGNATPPVNYLSFLGEWSFEINVPFYVWYHDISGQGWIA